MRSGHSAALGLLLRRSSAAWLATACHGATTPAAGMAGAAVARRTVEKEMGAGIEGENARLQARVRLLQANETATPCAAARS